MVEVPYPPGAPRARRRRSRDAPFLAGRACGLTGGWKILRSGTVRSCADMPIYEYECPKCGRFDVLQKMSAPSLEVHDVCGEKVKKLMSASAFALKGSGFYITDYGGKN